MDVDILCDPVNDRACVLAGNIQSKYSLEESATTEYPTSPWTTYINQDETILHHYTRSSIAYAIL